MEQLHKMYQHLEKAGWAEIISVCENLDEKQNVVVNFIFEKRFFAEIEFRFNEYPWNY